MTRLLDAAAADDRQAAATATIAIVDSGSKVDHEELAGRIVSPWSAVTGSAQMQEYEMAYWEKITPELQRFPFRQGDLQLRDLARVLQENTDAGEEKWRWTNSAKQPEWRKGTIIVAGDTLTINNSST